MEKKYIIKLTAKDKKELNKIVSNGNETAKRHKQAKILLHADGSLLKSRLGLSDQEIAKIMEVSYKTVSRIREKYSEGGLEKVFEKKFTPRLSRRKFDGEQEAKLIALCCGSAPEGYGSWSLRLLADRVVKLNIVDSVCHSTIDQTLKKTNLSHGRK